MRSCHRLFRFVSPLLIAAHIAVVTPAAAAPRTEAEERTGAAQHPRVLAEFGSYDDPALVDYVTSVARRITAVTDQAAAKWTVTILDTPVVNAFALPGGYLYVTRGLLALANDEAELAGVLGHEIAHVTLGHGMKRNDRGAKAGIGLVVGAVLGRVLGGKDTARDVLREGGKLVMGYMAGYSRDQEFAADREAVRLLSRAGFDPYAQADFLESLAAQARLQALLAGKEYNPNTVEFFDSHPATAERVRQAITEAKAQGTPVGDAPRGEERYMAAIEGLVFGDSRVQGFVRGRHFLHPELGFAYEVPDGFTILNSNRQVTARGPRDSRMILDGAGSFDGPLTRFVTEKWEPAIRREYEAGPLNGLEATSINGLEAATGRIRIDIAGKPHTVIFAAIRIRDRIFRLFGIAGADDRETLRGLSRALTSFRPLTPSEAAKMQPFRLRGYTVREGDTVPFLAAGLPFVRARDEWFRTLNGYGEDEPPQPGDRVKLVFD